MARPRLARCQQGHDMSITRRVSGGTSFCGECRKQFHRAYKRKTVTPERKEADKLRSRKWRKNNEDQQRLRSRKRLGIKDAVGDKRSGICPICEKDKPLVPDHNHSTGYTRGWVCDTCNRAMGLFGDSAEVLMKASLYLRSELIK